MRGGGGRKGAKGHETDFGTCVKLCICGEMGTVRPVGGVAAMVEGVFGRAPCVDFPVMQILKS